MNYSLVSRPAVQVDIIDIVDYYKKINPELAKQFLFRLREASVYISRSPMSFQIRYKGVRTLLLKQFPFHVHYLIDDKQKQIVILAIIHAYRNPTDYSSRE